ncbi:isoflavone reductase family protein [Corynespora cassiicola Philippines]|uniref:Isoflavone reductase family protein n=1 Tax=Corynespora cassiicola Philippines TaxID=1448308 RepID=A0A2T2NJ31_CORCC|nr:isoflavone reductase family protein [Corynespora cassiicola Philippines]
MSSFKNVMLIGASGNLGDPVLKEFRKSQYKVSVLARKESKSTYPEGVPVFNADYTDMNSLKAAMESQDVVICMVNPAAVSEQQILIDAAIAAGVKRYFPGEFGPYTRNEKFAEVNPYVLPVKTKVADYLLSKESQISWTGVVTGGFFDWGIETGFFGFDLASKTAALIDGGTSVFTSTTLPTIAKAVVAALDHAEETKNQYVFVSSFNLSQKNILEVIERVDGQKWSVEHLTFEEVVANGHKWIASGDFNGIKDLTRAAAFGKFALGDESSHGFWNDRLGLPKENVEEAVREIISGGKA